MIDNVEMTISDVMTIDSGTTIVHAHFRIEITVLQGVDSIKVVHRQGHLHSGPVDPRTDHLHLEDPGVPDPVVYVDKLDVENTGDHPVVVGCVTSRIVLVGVILQRRDVLLGCLNLIGPHHLHFEAHLHHHQEVHLHYSNESQTLSEAVSYTHLTLPTILRV